MVIFGLSGILFVFYRRKRAAYRVLVLKSQEWAASTTLSVAPIKNVEGGKEQSVSDVDRQLFEQLQQLLQDENLYRDSAISIEVIARRMKINRTYLSRAINNCSRKNFNVYINEFRIKEAIKLMSADDKKFSLEGFAFETGFNDRRAFYRAFRKLTGLSPSDFRSNLQKSL